MRISEHELVADLSSIDADVVGEAFISLRRALKSDRSWVPPESVVRVCRGLLRHGDPDIRADAVAVLGIFRPGLLTVSELQELLDVEQSTRVSANILSAVTQAGYAGTEADEFEAMKALRNASGDRRYSGKVRQRALAELALIAEALPRDLLVQLFFDRDLSTDSNAAGLDAVRTLTDTDLLRLVHARRSQNDPTGGKERD